MTRSAGGGFPPAIAVDQTNTGSRDPPRARAMFSILRDLYCLFFAEEGVGAGQMAGRAHDDFQVKDWTPIRRSPPERRWRLRPGSRSTPKRRSGAQKPAK